MVRALTESHLTQISIDVVVGQNYEHRDQLLELVRSRPRSTLHDVVPSLAGLFLRADVAMGAGGATTWERLALGLPSIVAITADNQAAFSRALAEDAYQVVVGEGATSHDWHTAISSIVDDPAKLKTLAANASTLLDAQGTKRVARLLLDELHGDLNVAVISRNVIADSVRLTIVDSSGLSVAASNFQTEVIRDAIGYEQMSEPDIASSVEIVDAAFDAAMTHWRLIEAPLRAAGGPHFIRLGDDRSLTSSRGAEPTMRITVLSDADTWMSDAISVLQRKWLEAGHHFRWIHRLSELVAGDACFLLGCSRIIKPNQIALHRHNLVVHASALPLGRGWSPMTWQLLEGSDRIPVTLFEAVEELDAGPIHAQMHIHLNGMELISEWQAKQAEATIQLCLDWVANFPTSASSPTAQAGEPTFYARRRPGDSRLDAERPLIDQFNLLRVIDNVRYPAFVNIRGRRYTIRIEADE